MKPIVESTTQFNLVGSIYQIVQVYLGGSRLISAHCRITTLAGV